MPTERPDSAPAGGAALARLRLMQLVSPALPVGGFTYSQGLEYAVEAGVVHDVVSCRDWLLGLIETSVTFVDIPVLARLYQACANGDEAAVLRWGRWLLASRETSELRAEEGQRGAALARLLVDLQVPEAGAWRTSLATCQAAGFALAAERWHIGLSDAVHGFAWSWLENMTTAAVKLVPLGQTDGQRIQFSLAGALPAAVERGLALNDEAMGASAPMLAIASSRHETQYTRLFRS